jgi:hypothetical protein
LAVAAWATPAQAIMIGPNDKLEITFHLPADPPNSEARGPGRRETRVAIP